LDLPAHIIERMVDAIRELQARFAIDPRDAWAAVACNHDALPLYRDLGGTGCLRTSGEIICLGIDDEGPVTTLDPSMELSLLVAGSKKYPWLGALLPVRCPTDRDCPVCRGRGQLLLGQGGSIYCSHCNALGWTNSATPTKDPK
jgi:hypothetical protein